MRNLSFTFLTALLSMALVFGQGACSDLVNEALASAQTNCGDLGRNEACYGYDNVQASFLTEVPDDYFSEVRQVSPVVDLASIQTLPLNLETQEWGVAVMNIQAKLPGTLPGTNITFVLMGDTTVENAVAPEDAFVPSDGIDVSLAVDSANLRSGAGLNFNVIAGAVRGEVLLADGLSEDGTWVRVIKDTAPAWLNRSLLAENSAIANLPVVNDEVMMPMQAIYLRTTIVGTECVDAPVDGLVVQGPDNFQVQLSINGANVKLGSTGIFRTIDVNGEPFLELTVLDGVFEIDGTEVRTGQVTTVCLGDESSRGLDGQANDLVVSCGPTAPKYVQNFGAEWCDMENLPSEILNYEIDVVCPGETPVPAATEEVTAADGTVIVDCNSFAILTGDIPATNFTLSWTGIVGADRYEVAVFDSGGYQISSTTTGGTSLDMNGGTSFPPSGYVDVRAFGGGEYLCFGRRDFTRSVDPNVVIAPPVDASGPNVNFSCVYDVVTELWDIKITWTGMTPPVSVGYTGSGTFPPGNNQIFGTSSGVYSISASDPAGADPVQLSIGDALNNNYATVC